MLVITVPIIYFGLLVKRRRHDAMLNYLHDKSRRTMMVDNLVETYGLDSMNFEDSTYDVVYTIDNDRYLFNQFNHNGGASVDLVYNTIQSQVGDAIFQDFWRWYHDTSTMKSFHDDFIEHDLKTKSSIPKSGHITYEFGNYKMRLSARKLRQLEAQIVDEARQYQVPTFYVRFYVLFKGARGRNKEDWETVYKNINFLDIATKFPRKYRTVYPHVMTPAERKVEAARKVEQARLDKERKNEIKKRKQKEIASRQLATRENQMFKKYVALLNKYLKARDSQLNDLLQATVNNSKITDGKREVLRKQYSQQFAQNWPQYAKKQQRILKQYTKRYIQADERLSLFAQGLYKMSVAIIQSDVVSVDTWLDKFFWQDDDKVFTDLSALPKHNAYEILEPLMLTVRRQRAEKDRKNFTELLELNESSSPAISADVKKTTSVKPTVTESVDYEDALVALAPA